LVSPLEMVSPGAARPLGPTSRRHCSRGELGLKPDLHGHSSISEVTTVTGLTHSAYSIVIFRPDHRALSKCHNDQSAHNGPCC